MSERYRRHSHLWCGRPAHSDCQPPDGRGRCRPARRPSPRPPRRPAHHHLRRPATPEPRPATPPTPSWPSSPADSKLIHRHAHSTIRVTTRSNAKGIILERRLDDTAHCEVPSIVEMAAREGSVAAGGHFVLATGTRFAEPHRWVWTGHTRRGPVHALAERGDSVNPPLTWPVGPSCRRGCRRQRRRRGSRWTAWIEEGGEAGCTHSLDGSGSSPVSRARPWR
jgi:hypothetical protein